jgi:pteridine reductase
VLIESRVAVVTGAARRIGACIAATLARRGAAVVINYRSSTGDAAATVDRIRTAGGRAIAVAGDMSRAEDVDRLFDATLAAFGRVDVLVNNASSFRRTPLETLNDADWDDMIDNNLHAARRPALRFGRWMRDNGGGAIVNLADTAAERPWRGYLPYSVAKAGIVALTRGLARELAPEVRVNAIAPGPIVFPDDFDTAARDREIARTLLRREGDPQNIADAVVALIENDYITGVLLPVDGGRSLAS